MNPRDQEQVPKETDDVVEPAEGPDDELEPGRVPRPIDPDEEDPLGRPVQLQP